MNFASVTVDQIEFFLLIFVRTVTIISVMPFFGSNSIPPQLKVGFSFVLAIILFPLIPHPAPGMLPTGLGYFFLGVIREVFAGLLIGFVASFLLTAVQFAGRLVDTEMGFTFVELVDPFTEESVTTLGQLYILIFTIFFLCINGHYFFLMAIQKSFEIIPVLGVKMPDGPLVLFLTNLTTGIFSSSLQLAAPVFITLFITNVALGVVARTVPQINVYFVGVPVTIILGLSTAIVAFPFVAGTFRKITEVLMQDIWRLLYLMA